jgi:hypothetical protein
MKSITTIEISDEMKRKITKYVSQNGSITNRQCRELLGIGYDQAITLFNKMVNTGELIREGKTSSVNYRLPNNLWRRLTAAYGWPADLSDEQILEKLLALDLERAGRE